MQIEKISSQRIGDFYYRIKHPTGLDIYLYPREGFSTTFAIFGTKYGSIDNRFRRSDGNEVETVPEGIAHFLEHKLFESEDGDAFERYSKTGASANAATSFESTCYLFSCTSRLYDSLEILLDFVQSPYFTEKTVAKEQGIIAQEIKMYDDDPGWQVMMDYLRAMYKTHPISIDIAGTVESIAQITPEHLYRCYDTFYNLHNMVLTLAGSFELDRVLEICDRMLKPNEQVTVERVFSPEPEMPDKHYIEKKMSVAMPIFQYGFKLNGADRRSEKDIAAIKVLLETLFSDASPFFKRLLDEGLINESSFDYELFEGAGYATVFFSGESRDAVAVAEAINEEMNRAVNEGVSIDSFERSKRSLYGENIAALNSTGSIADSLISFAFKGRELFTYIDALSSLDLSDCTEKLKLFEKEKSVLSVINPIT